MRGIDFKSDFVLRIFFIFVMSSQPVLAYKESRTELTLVDEIIQRKYITQDRYTKNVSLVHSPYPIDVQFSADGSILFSLSETLRLWRSDNGEYLRGIAGPSRFIGFAQLKNSHWIVTLDDPGYISLNGLKSRTPQIIPKLRLWDTISGKCLGSHSVCIPVNATAVSISKIETAEQFDTVYVIVEYEEESSKEQEFVPSVKKYCQLQGFQGEGLQPCCKLELEDFKFEVGSPHDSMTWDPHTKRLYIFGRNIIKSFNPVTMKFKALTIPIDSTKPFNHIDEVRVFDPATSCIKSIHPHNNLSSLLLVTYFSQQSKTPKTKHRAISLEWVLVDSLSGVLLKRGVVKRKFKPISINSRVNKAEPFFFWLNDEDDHSIKVVNILDNQILFSMPRNDTAISKSLIESSRNLTYLFRDKYRDVDEKVIWSEAANRACYIRGELETFNLFNTRTKKYVTNPSGVVNSLSAISTDKVSAALDWNQVSVLHLEAGNQITQSLDKTISGSSCVALSADATTLVVGDISGNAQIWSVTESKKLGILNGAMSKLLCIAIDADKSHILAGDSNGDFWGWNTPPHLPITSESLKLTANKIKNIPPHLPINKRGFLSGLTSSLCTISSNASLSLSFVPAPIDNFAGEYLDLDTEIDFESKLGGTLMGKTGVELIQGKVLANNIASKQIILTPAVQHKSILMKLKSSSNGRFAILVFNTGQVTIVDLQTGTLESIIQTKDKEIVDVNYHHENKILLVASYRGLVTSWNTDTYIEAGRLRLQDARLSLLSSRISEEGFDIVLGTRDTGLIIKRDAFHNSK